MTNTMTSPSGRPWTMDEVLIHVGKGWHPLVRRLIDDLFALGWDGRLGQIKEKFGGLRFYVDFDYDEDDEAVREAITARIDAAAEESLKTCEKCGAPGKPGDVTRYWIKTLCDEHAG